MTTLAFDEDGVEVVYEGTEFRLERELIEEATEKAYWDVTDHEILRMVDPDPVVHGQAKRIGDILE